MGNIFAVLDTGKGRIFLIRKDLLDIQKETSNNPAKKWAKAVNLGTFVFRANGFIFTHKRYSGTFWVVQWFDPLSGN